MTKVTTALGERVALATEGDAVVVVAVVVGTTLPGAAEGIVVGAGAPVGMRLPGAIEGVIVAFPPGDAVGTDDALRAFGDAVGASVVPGADEGTSVVPGADTGASVVPGADTGATVGMSETGIVVGEDDSWTQNPHERRLVADVGSYRPVPT